MGLLFGVLVVAIALATVAPAGAQETCSHRAGLCRAACTPGNVASGAQYGGTVQGCLRSCNSRYASCMRSGIWVHMGARTRGMRQQVERR
jgi:hypothetical protein